MERDTTISTAPLPRGRRPGLHAAVFAALVLALSAGAAHGTGVLLPETARDPVVLVHGYSGSIAGDFSVEAYWAFVGSRLALDGFDAYKIALGAAAIQDIRTSAGELRDFVAGVLARTGKDKVDLIVHSEGGLVSRYYIRFLGGGAYVDDLVTIASPHRGTTVASIGIGEAARQMEVLSPFLRELNSPPHLTGDVDYTAVFSNHDELVFPAENGFLAGAVNVVYNLLGHVGIIFNEDVYRAVRGAVTNDLARSHRAVPIAISKNSITTNNPDVTLVIEPSNHLHPGATMKQMMIADNPFMHGASWAPVASSVIRRLDTATGDGLKGVYVKFREKDSFLGLDDKESPVYVDYVFYDSTPPTAAIDVLPEAALSSTVEVGAAADDNGDNFKAFMGWNALFAYGIDELGVKEMILSANPDFAGAQWRPFSERTTVDLGPGGGLRTVYARVRDGAGNESATVSDTVYVADPASPLVGMTDEGDADPVVLVHGYSGSVAGGLSVEAYWSFIGARLELEGFEVHKIALGAAALQDIRTSAAELRDFVSVVLARTGAAKADVVCHSEGGLVARYYVQNLGGSPFVDDLVTISTPHRGTIVASIGPGTAARQMEVGSAFLRELNAADITPGGVEYTALLTLADEAVVPQQNAFLEGAVNVTYTEFGHAGVLFHPDPYAAVRAALANRSVRPGDAPPVEIAAPDAVTAARQLEVVIRPFNHYAPGTPVAEMLIADNPGFYGAAWRPLASKAVLDISSAPDGLLGVHVRFRGADGVVSPIYSDYVIVDRAPPSGGVEITAADAKNSTLEITVTARDNTDAYSSLDPARPLEAFGIPDLGAREMMLSVTPDFAGAAWEPLALPRTIQVPPGAGEKAVHVKLRDAAGNVSPAYSASTQFFDKVNGYTAAEDERDPVVFVHGYGGSFVGDVSSYLNWAYYVERLRAEGWSAHVISLDNAAIQDVRTSAEQLGGFVADVLARTGARKVDLVCHSEGGLVARYYVQNLGGSPFVDDLVTIATPHRGTVMAELGIGEAARQMEVAGAFLRELNSRDVTPGVVNYTSVFTVNDEMVVPPENAFFEGAINVVTGQWEHATILFNDEVFAVVKSALLLDTGREPAELPVHVVRDRMVTSSPSVTLSLNYYNHNSPLHPPGGMMVSNDRLFRDAAWRPVSNTLPWTLEGDDGLKAVYVKYKPAGSGDESPVYADYIVLDRTPPAGAFILTPDPDDPRTVHLSITASDDSDVYGRLNLDMRQLTRSYGITGLGVTRMIVCSAPDFVGCAYEPFAGTKAWRLAEGDTAVYVRFADAAGNESAVVSAPVPRAEAAPAEAQPALPAPAGQAGAASAPAAPALPLEISLHIRFDGGWNLVYLPAGLPAPVEEPLLSLVERSGGIFDPVAKEFLAPSRSWLAETSRALWTHLEAPFSTTVAFTPEPASAAVLRRIPLAPGWNVIGVSGYRTVPLDRLSITAGGDELTFHDAYVQGWISQDLLTYSAGRYAPAGALQPFRAYFIRAFRSCLLNLP
ncbi:MAG: hypothetical protein AB1742_05595 [bacterium]